MMDNQLRKHIIHYHDFLNNLKDVKRSIINTKYCIDKNITVYYAVDFSEVFRYVSPNSELNGITASKWEPIEKIFIREQLTLNILFQDFGKLVLLPPHLYELERYLKRMTDNVVQDFSESYWKEFKDKITNNAEFISLISSIDITKVKKNKNYTQSEKKIIDRLITEYFGELKFISIYEEVITVQRIKQLVDDKKIIGINEFFEEINMECELDIGSIEKEASNWYEIFITARKYPNFQLAGKARDALACSYLSTINDFLLKDKKYLAFVTRSQIMLDSLSKLDLKKVDGEYLIPSRNLYSILEIINHFKVKENKTNKQYNRIYEGFVQRLINLTNIKGEFSRERINLMTEDKMTDLLEGITNIYSELIASSNIKLFIHDLDMEEELTESFKLNNERKIIQKLKELYYSDKIIRDGILDTLENHETLINLMNSLRNEVFKSPSEDHFDKLHLTRINNVTVIDFNGIEGEMSSKFKLYNKESIKLARDIYENKRSFKEVFKYSKEELELKPEIKLIYAYNEAIEKRYEKAIEILSSINAENEFVNEELFIEVNYLLIQLFRKTGAILNGLKIYNIISKMFGRRNKKDPRFLREYGVLIWLATKKGEHFINRIRKTQDEKIEITTSITYTLDSLAEAFDVNLKLRCYNSLAYYYAELMEIDKANNCLLQIDLLKHDLEGNEIQVPPRFYDTYGFVHFQESKRENKKSIKKELLNKAKMYYLKAFSSGELVFYEESLLFNHILNVRRAINDIE